MLLARTLIDRKRDGGRITADEWRALADAYLAGEVPDYQMAALLMAVVFRSLDPDETAALTRTMLGSGERLALGDVAAARLDKHSTGGVGDKVSLVLAPLVAACGVAVPMMSGRGLGHTGGTLDKLESIPGFRTGLSLREAREQIARLGCALIGQTAEIAPLDRRLYALRDATGTVASIPLIAASIMSKKLAEDLTGLVLDVKQGSGAFLPDEAQGLALAETMIALGAGHGCPVVALLTAMDRPLGEACGNALEVAEAIAALRDGGPADLREVTLALGAEMLLLAGTDADRAAARRRLEAALASGAAAERFARIVEAQGGDPRVLDEPGRLPQAPERRPVPAPRDGTVASVEPRGIGLAVIALGGGRARMEDVVDPAVGVVVTARPGDRVRRGEPLATVHASTAAAAEAGVRAVTEAITLVEPGAPTPAPLPLVGWRVSAAGRERLAG